MSVQDPDALLDAILRNWIASLPPGTATLARVPPSSHSGRGFLVTPTREGAAPIRLWVGEGRERVSVQVGRSARFEDWPLAAASVEQLCASVACGGFLEEAWTLGTLTLARRASLIVGGDQTLRWATRSPVLPVPFARWVRHAPHAWLG